MAKKCPACNADNRDGALVCEYCGTRLSSDKPKSVEASEEKRFCTSCGKPLSPDAAFCPFCGAKRNGAAQTSAPAPEQVPAARQVPIPPRASASQGAPAYMQPGYQQQVRAQRQAAQNASKTKKSTRGLSVFLSLLLAVQFCVAAFKYPGFLRGKIGTTETEDDDFLTVELTESDFIVKEDPEDVSAGVGGVSSIVFDAAHAVSTEDRTVGGDSPDAEFANGVSVSFGDFCLYDESHTLTVAALGQKSDEDYNAVGYDIRLDGGDAEFDGLVEVSLPYDASWGENVFVQYFNEKTGAWEILYAEPDGDGHITFRTDHFCEFAVFKYAVEHGYGDSSEEVLSFENYGGDKRLKRVLVNWDALAARVRAGKLKNEAGLARLTSKGDPYSTENIMNTCGNVTEHLDFLAKITRIPGLSEKVLGPLGQMITVSSFLYQGHTHGWAEAFEENKESLSMLAVGAGSALPPPVGPVCAVISGGYYVYKTSDSVLKYIKFNGFSSEAENIYRNFTRNQIQYDRKRGIVLYSPGSVKYYALHCGEKESQHQMWKLVFEDAEKLERNGVMSANAYVQRIITQYVNLFWNLPTQMKKSFLGTEKLPNERTQDKYVKSMKNDLCAWLKPYLSEQMEKEYIKSLNNVWSYYTKLEEELNTLYGIELIDPEHEYFTGSPYFNHPIGLGVSEIAKPSFVNEWEDVARTCRISFTAARWADEGCPEYLRILGKKGDVWNYNFSFYTQKLTLVPNKALVVTLPTQKELENMEFLNPEPEIPPEEQGAHYVWALDKIQVWQQSWVAGWANKNPDLNTVRRVVVEGTDFPSVWIFSHRVVQRADVDGIDYDTEFSIELPGRIVDRNPAEENKDKYGTDFKFTVSVISGFDEPHTPICSDQHPGPFMVYAGHDIYGNWVDDPDSDDPEDTIPAGTDIMPEWYKTSECIYDATKALPEATKGNSVQVYCKGAMFDCGFDALVTYVAIPESTADTMIYELEYGTEPQT
ncbi:MAG: zinc ribbon domain-containing protein [Clostridia bacterium]|nr:zinc ribbon domain-containing protein [Clostridia bacterium]